MVFADEIHAAARVRKIHSTSTAAFAPLVGGPVGYLVEGAPVLVSQPVRRYSVTGRLRGQPRVGLYVATLGDDGGLLPSFAADLDGLVVAGFGVGHVPASWVPALTEVAARIPVVLASRTGAGPVLSTTYGFPGSERDLKDRGLIRAGLLDGYKARILLYCLLAADTDHAGIRAAFATAGGMDN